MSGSVPMWPSSSIEWDRSSLRAIKSTHKLNWLTIDGAFLRIDANRTDQPARCGGGGKRPPQIVRRNQNGRTTNQDEACLLESVVFDPRTTKQMSSTCPSCEQQLCGSRPKIQEDNIYSTISHAVEALHSSSHTQCRESCPLISVRFVDVAPQLAKKG